MPKVKDEPVDRTYLPTLLPSLVKKLMKKKPKSGGERKHSNDDTAVASFFGVARARAARSCRRRRGERSFLLFFVSR
jgi:hypothetical protein